MKFLTVIPVIFFILSLHLSAQVTEDYGRQEAAVPLNLDEVTGMLMYPEIARETKIEDKILIKVLVDTLGNVEKTGSLMGAEVFYEEVKRVAVFLKFTPAKYNGKPVLMWTTIPFTFKLPNK